MERFFEKVRVVDRGHATPCWQWTGGRNQYGYGVFWADSRLHVAARWLYEQTVGPIEDRLQLDHFACDGGPDGCVNPEHVRPTTHRENSLRADTPLSENLAKTSCVNGHPFDGGNTYVDRNGGRSCRACHRAREARRRAIRKERR